MRTNEFFCLSRFYYLCRQSIGKERNDITFLCLKIIAIFILGTALLGFIGLPSITIAPLFYYLILYFVGIRWAANAFPELRNKEKCCSWLMVPGSAFEKYISRLILSSIGFAVLFSVLYFIGVNIGNIINLIVFNNHFIPFVPFETVDVPFTIASLVTLHSIFCVGGLYFKRYPIVKTVLFVLLIIILLMVSISTIGGLLFSYRVSFNVQNFPILSRYWTMSVSWFFKLFFYCIIPVFCWVIGYFRLKKVEVC